VGFSVPDVAKVLGENWRNFMRKAFKPEARAEFGSGA
jgi:hypothetical protein